MTGLEMKYFVLNPTSSDREFAWASRNALREFAVIIRDSNPKLCEDIMEWVESIEKELMERTNDTD